MIHSFGMEEGEEFALALYHDHFQRLYAVGSGCSEISRGWRYMSSEAQALWQNCSAQMAANVPTNTSSEVDVDFLADEIVDVVMVNFSTPTSALFLLSTTLMVLILIRSFRVRLRRCRVFHKRKILELIQAIPSNTCREWV